MVSLLFLKLVLIFFLTYGFGKKTELLKPLIPSFALDLYYTFYIYIYTFI